MYQMATLPPNLKQAIKERLIEQFQTWPLETRLPSVRALAAEFGAAYLTVDGAMRELEWEGYVRRVPRKGAFLASRERTVVHDLETGGKDLKTLVFAYPNFFSYATWIRLHHAETQAVQRGMALVELKLTPETDYANLHRIIDQRDRVEGVIVIPKSGPENNAATANLDNLGLPVVALAEFPMVSLTHNMWAIHPDWVRSGYLKARQLLDAGHECIAFVQHEPAASERRKLMTQGMRQAMREAGLPQRNLVMYDADTEAWADSRAAAHRLTRQLLEDRQATGAMYETMRGPQGAILAAHELGASIPGDLSIVSTGRGSDDEAYMSPPITTIDPDPEAEIALAFDCLLRPRRHPTRGHMIRPTLCERASVAPPGAVYEPRESIALVKGGLK